MSIAGPKLTGVAGILLACIAVTRGAYHGVFNLRGTASSVGIVARLGQVSVSVYDVHPFIIWLLLPYIGNDSPWRVIVLTSLVLGLSTGLSFLLQRADLLRPFII